ncbi:MAG: efflux transporter outer membrane subunit [Gemmatimonadetes bacterium]|nr:efflux transporter outer membrane subunit [Gemmatimonadota bacterium]
MRRIFPLVFILTIPTCSLVPGRNLPEPESIPEMPGAFAAGVADSGTYQPLEWWKTFEDPVLDRVVEEVLSSNFDLAGAVARVQQARSRAGVARASAFPLVQPSVGVNDFDGPTNAGIGAQLEEVGLDPEALSAAGVEIPDRLGLTTYTLSMEFAYELDFWGRNRNDTRSAEAELAATEADYLSARMGVLAETVRTYLEISSLRRQQGLAGEIVAVLQQLESLAESQYERGLIELGDLHAARRRLREAQAELPQIEALRADAEGRLWILMGGFRADLAHKLSNSPGPSPVLKPVPTGIPADLMVQRPDVLAAMQRVEAARYSVSARRAALLPRLSLQGAIGLQSTDSSEWFDPDQWFRNLTMNLLGPVIQGSRLQRNIALAEARLNEAAAAYGRSVVTAVNEVESALLGLEASRRRHALLESLSNETRAESALQEQRYVSGVGAYEAFLAAEQTRLAAQSVLAAAVRDLGYARLALHRSLGGTWTATDSERLRLQQTQPEGRLPSSPPTE